MTKTELIHKELSNLYAINKQINQYFNGSDISFLSEKHQQVLMEYLELTCSIEDNTSIALDKLEINPTNTTDSIVEEMTENLQQIITQNIDNDLQSLGYRMSLHRLVSYQLANMENSLVVAKGDIENTALEDLSKKVAQLKTRMIHD